MYNEQQRYYQRNLSIGIVSMIVLAFVFALWVNSLKAPVLDETSNWFTSRPFIVVTDLFARKIRIEGRDKSGNKIGISQTRITQSGADVNSASSGLDLSLTLARSAFEYRLEKALDTVTADYSHAAITLPASRRLGVLSLDSISPRTIVSLPSDLEWPYTSKCPETTIVYGYIIADRGGTVLIIDSLSPDNRKVRRAVKRTFARTIDTRVTRFMRIPYIVHFIRGEGVLRTSTGNYDVRYR